jgi:putative salt-induced outer membrane protein YdiY
MQRFMIQQRPSFPVALITAFVSGWLLLTGLPAGAQLAVLHLKSGDQISGRLILVSTNRMVISNAWAGSISVPLDEIAKCDDGNPALARSNVYSPDNDIKTLRPAPSKVTATVSSTSVKPPEEPEGKWNGEVRLGLDTIVSTADSQDYSGHLKLTYERPYDGNPKKYFRNTSNLDAEYQKTDGTESSDHLLVNNKSDFDISAKSYGYALFGSGCDEVQKINYQYQFGPGAGVHLIKKSRFNLNLESGLDYEYQSRKDADDLRTISVRLAQDLTWKIVDNLRLVQSFLFYPDVVDPGEFHNSLESTLSYGFWKNLSLNLTALNDYDTEVAPGVNRNRFELRSTLGVTF